MDDALRALERKGDDPVGLCLALRRAGREVEARRTLEAAVRAGDAAARAALDELWPLDERVARIVEAGLERTTEPPAEMEGRLAWVVADEDPRLDPWIERLAWTLERLPGYADLPEDDRARQLVEMSRRPPAERRQAVIARAGRELPAFAATRLRLDAEEAAAMLARAPMPSSPSARVEHPSLVLAALDLVGRSGAHVAADQLAMHAASADPLVAAEAWLAQARLGCARNAEVRPRLLTAPWRPAWEDGPAIELRDGLTLAYRRASWTTRDPWSRSEALVRDDVGGWVLDIDADHLKRVCDMFGHHPSDRALVALTRCLHACVGDRVCRWAGDEWLVRLEPEHDGLAVAEGLRRAVETLDLGIPDAPDLRVTVTIGVARAASWIDAIRPAEEAMHAGKRSKDPRNCVRSA